MILDAAHNDSSIFSLIETYKSIYPANKPIVIFGVSDDKMFVRMLTKINDCAERVILTKAQHPRAHTFKENDLSGVMDLDRVVFTENVQEALNLVKTEYNKKNILVTGSVFVVSEARQFLDN